MARSKQATPVRREESSEFISKKDRVLQRSASDTKEANGKAKGHHVAPKTSEKAEGGVLQLVIAVAGIYGSL
jgi:UDP-galactose transporter B1